MAKTGLPRLALIGVGGTISSFADDNLDVFEYPDNSRKMPPDEVIARTPELGRFADCVPLPYRGVGSTAIGPEDWISLAALISKCESDQPSFAGYVILHGTATLEETAYFLNLVLKTEKPVVLVGSQRPASALSTDAVMNLISAVRTAVEPGARGLGVLVVLNDEIHAAREAVKTSTHRLQTFRSPDFGLLGHVDGDRVSFYRRPIRKHTVDTIFAVQGLSSLPRVDIAYGYAGADGAEIAAYIAAGAKGLVSAGLPPGIPASAQRCELERAAASGIVVVQACRAWSGRVIRRRYLRERGIVAADNLNPQKARILLALALTRTRDPDAIQDYFETY